MDYERELSIDPHNLAEEWLQQPMLYMRYSTELAKARKRLGFAIEKEKVVRSELTKEVHQHPEKLPGGKATAPVVEAYFRANVHHRALKDEIIEREYEANMLEGAVFAFSQRKTALENLVKLYIAQYFAGPKEPLELPAGRRGIDVQRAREGATSDKLRGRLRRG